MISTKHRDVSGVSLTYYSPTGAALPENNPHGLCAVVHFAPVSYALRGLGRYRVKLCQQYGNPSVTFRHILHNVEIGQSAGQSTAGFCKDQALGARDAQFAFI
eukprot:scaffold84536_cov26-Prasinocladus_malaysianus.AAC.1